MPPGRAILFPAGNGLAMIKASEFKKGDVVKLGGEPHVVETVTVQTPGARGAVTLYKVRFRNLLSKRKVDQVFRGDDVLPEADFERRPVQVLYGDSSSYAFMDLQDYSQFSLAKEDLEEEWPYLTADLEGVVSIVSDGRVVGIELPVLVTLRVEETSPPLRGASAAARGKPAVLSTGLVIQVPDYLAVGDLVKVDTRTGLFVSKA
jgi:elongation factor P